MTPWLELYRNHRGLHEKGARSLAEAFRRRFVRLAHANHCDASLPHRFTYKVSSNRRQWSIRAPEGQAGGEWAEPLAGCRTGVASAKLTVLALTDASVLRLEMLTVMLEVTRSTGANLLVAVHLDDHPLGVGACGHALLHCHVGETMGAQPKVRVPFPNSEPGSVLDWMLTIVLEDWEPAPWEAVAAALAAESTGS